METKLQKLKDEALKAIEAAGSPEEIEAVRVRFLGKKGELTQILRGMGGLSPEERPRIGQLVNQAREEVESRLAARFSRLEMAGMQQRFEAERIDITLPGRRRRTGTRHPFSIVLDEIVEIFAGLGFSVAEGPEVELDYYNFEAMNMPREHSAREAWDSLYITPEILLRTHTSPVQARVMETMRPRVPIKIIVPGRVYRRDALDATHSPVFNQIEGLVVDKGITFGDLKGTLEAFVHALYGPDQKVRFRPSYFPFTEPSAEMDVSCFACGGAGCRICKSSGWIEILGCGSVHPNVLRMSGYDPEEVTGFAFGMGLERIAMRKYDIDDIRLFYENDLRFLEQFRVEGR